MQHFAKLTPNDIDGKENYELLSEKIKIAFHHEFYNPSQYIIPTILLRQTCCPYILVFALIH